MVLHTLTPPTGPLIDYTSEPTVKVLTAEFGDGHIQATPDGVNSVRYSHAFSWTLPKADIDAMDAFLKERAGAFPFLFRPPWGAAGTTQRFLCKKWSRARVSPLIHTLTATFEEDFG